MITGALACCALADISCHAPCVHEAWTFIELSLALLWPNSCPTPQP